MAAPGRSAAVSSDPTMSETDLKCSACGETGKEFSNRQRNKAIMLGEPARCKQCVESNTNAAIQAPENKKERLYFSDGESVSNASSSSSSSSEENEHKDEEEDDENGVSLNALKERILGRKLITPQDLVGEQQVREELKLPVIENASQLRKELSCAICQEPFYQPLSLSCGHSFCSQCLLWWLNHHSKSTSSPHGTCPTCRTNLVCSGESLGVNTALRAAVIALYGDELKKRNQADKLAKLKATAGENGGAHNSGYQVQSQTNEHAWKKLNVKDSNGLYFYARRSIVLDAADVRMRLALAVDCQPGAPPPVLVDNVLQVALCVLSMEEDEAEDSGFPLTLHDEDDDALISSEERFQSNVKVTVRGDGLNVPLVLQQELNGTGAVTFGVPLGQSDDTIEAFVDRYIRIIHQETGAEYEIKVSRNQQVVDLTMASTGSRLQENGFVDDSARARGGVMMDDEDDYHRGEKDEYEDDGFLVMEEVEESDASESSHDEDEADVCCVCREHGELIVCDGGDHFEGCGSSFHVACVDRDHVPPGDWICGNCASVIDLDVGLRGYEFTEKEEKKKESGNKRVLEESSGDESDSHAFVAPAAKKKRARIIDSDSDED